MRSQYPHGEAKRLRILDRVHEAPGIHKSALRRELGLGWGTLNHHLNILESRHEIEIELGAREARVFPVDLPTHYKKWFGLLRDPTNADIVDTLTTDPLAMPDIATALKLSKRTTRNHLSDLCKAGLIEQHGHKFRTLPRALQRVRLVDGLIDEAKDDRHPQPPIRGFGTRLSPEEHNRRHTAYHTHDGDTDAALSLGISAPGFALWRSEQGLPAKRSNKLSHEEETRRLHAYDLSRNDEEAATRLDVKLGTFRAWRRNRGLDAKGTRHRKPLPPPETPRDRGAKASHTQLVHAQVKGP